MVVLLLDPLKLLHHFPRHEDPVALELCGVVFKELDKAPVHQEAGVCENLVALESVTQAVVLSRLGHSIILQIENGHAGENDGAVLNSQPCRFKSKTRMLAGDWKLSKCNRTMALRQSSSAAAIVGTSSYLPTPWR